MLDAISSARYSQEPRSSKRGTSTQRRPSSGAKSSSMEVHNRQAASDNRSELLKAVREKMNKGFYNSEAVLDDLSRSFAGAFDKLV